VGGYGEAYRRSIRQPDEFWSEAALGISWDVAPATVTAGGRWFPDGRLNTCFNAVDRHVAAGRGDQAALIHDSPVTGAARTFTYAELLDQVARTAGMLRGLGVTAGDTVVIYMPMVPEV
jgi:propionyl-CoA synthetase